MKKRWLKGSIFMILLFAVASCGGGSNDGDVNSGRSTRISIQFPFQFELSPTRASIQSAGENITSMTIIVEGDFPAIEETFIFPGLIKLLVPVGPNRTFRLLAFDTNGLLIFRGMAEGVDIFPGENRVSIIFSPVAEVCFNGIEDDEDDLIDCSDPDCNGQQCDIDDSTKVCINRECVAPTPTPHAADLSIIMSDFPDPVIVENNLTYSITVNNNGPDPASGVVVTDTLPEGVTFVSSSASQGNCSGTSIMTCDLGNLAMAASATVSVEVTPNTTGLINNTADVIGNENDPNTFNNTATQSTIVNPLPTLQIVNDLVTLIPIPSTFNTTTDTSGCPSGFVGKLSFVSRLTNKGTSPPISDLVIQVTTLTNGNLLQNADGGPGGAGARLTVQGIDTLNPEEFVDIPFIICLKDNNNFNLLVDVLGIVN